MNWIELTPWTSQRCRVNIQEGAPVWRIICSSVRITNFLFKNWYLPEKKNRKSQDFRFSSKPKTKKKPNWVSLLMLCGCVSLCMCVLHQITKWLLNFLWWCVFFSERLQTVTIVLFLLVVQFLYLLSLNRGLTTKCRSSKNEIHWHNEDETKRKPKTTKKINNEQTLFPHSIRMIHSYYLLSVPTVYRRMKLHTRNTYAIETELFQSDAKLHPIIKFCVCFIFYRNVHCKWNGSYS